MNHLRDVEPVNSLAELKTLLKSDETLVKNQLGVEIEHE